MVTLFEKLSQPAVEYPSVTVDSDYNSIYAEGKYHWEKTTEHVLKFSYCVKMLKDRCEVLKGGSEFGYRANDAWGLGASTASKYLSIGKQFEYFFKNEKVLPAAFTTLTLLTRLTEDELKELIMDKKIHAGLNGKEAKRLVDQVEKERDKQLESGPSVHDSQQFETFLEDKIYPSLPVDIVYRIAEKLNYTIRPPSITILQKFRKEMLEQLDEFNASQQKKFVPLLNNILFRVDDYTQECVEENIVEAFHLKHQEIDKSKAILEKWEENLVAEKVTVPTRALSPEELTYLRGQLDDAGIKVLNRVFTDIPESYNDQSCVNNHAPPQPSPQPQIW